MPCQGCRGGLFSRHHRRVAGVVNATKSRAGGPLAGWGPEPRWRAPTSLTAKARQSRSCQLASEGDFARACGALVQAAPLPCDAALLAALQAKHPQQHLPDLAALGPARPGAMPEFGAFRPSSGSPSRGPANRRRRRGSCTLGGPSSSSPACSRRCACYVGPTPS